MSKSNVTSLIPVILLALLAAPARATPADRSPMPEAAASHASGLSARQAPGVYGKLTATRVVPPAASRAGRASGEDERARGTQCMIPGTAQGVRFPEPADVTAWRAAFALGEAKAELRAVLEPGPDDLLGVASGNPRLSEGYWQRMRRLERSVSDAQRDLDAAEAECRALG